MDNKKKTISVSILLILITILSFGFVELNPIVSAIKSPKEELLFTISEYSSSEKYYDYVKDDLNNYQEIVADENGIIKSLLDAKEDIYTYNMKKIAKYGLVMYSAYIEYDNEQYYEIAKIQADALIDFQDKETGMFYNDYDVTLKQVNEVVSGKWSTSEIQGEAISLLSRMYIKTEDIKYKNSCELALKAFEKESSEGGLVSYLDKNIFYDGYNLDYGIYNLTSFIKGLIGLNDCYNNLNNEYAKELFDIGVQTLKECIYYYDKDGYTLMDLCNKEKEYKANRNEFLNQTLALKTINDIKKDEKLDNILNKWMSFFKGEQK